jgi:hypothetical protein
MRLAVITPTLFAPLQRRWMDELVGPVPKETSSTCDSCVKLAPAGEAQGPDHYDPQTKCCTYLPMIHNFLAGALLEDDDPEVAEGRATVEARIDAGAAVTPLGLYATEEYLSRYDAGARFGRDVTLRCPHYLHHRGGACGVWRHRESTCSTWYCRHDRGDPDRRFWREGAGPLLRAAELALAKWCAESLGAGECEWGRWQDQPRALYKAARPLAANLSWREVEEIGGDEVRRLAQATKRLRDWL